MCHFDMQFIALVNDYLTKEYEAPNKAMIVIGILELVFH